MTETWLDWCIKRPMPEWKKGYGGVYYRGLDEIEGEVKHSTEGSLGSALHELDRPDRDASWHFTIDAGMLNPLTGEAETYQHAPLEWILWHCGLPGDRRTDTSLIGNVTLIGEEHVDRTGAGQLAHLLPHQVKASAHITRDVRRLCPRVRANPPTLKLNQWEHNWLSSTACPSGLIPWQDIFALTEDEMDPALEAKLRAFFLEPHKRPEYTAKFPDRANWTPADIVEAESAYSPYYVDMLKSAVAAAAKGNLTALKAEHKGLAQAHDLIVNDLGLVNTTVNQIASQGVTVDEDSIATKTRQKFNEEPLK